MGRACRHRWRARRERSGRTRASRPRPNLVVLADAMHVRNAHLTTTFVVLNAGGARAGGSSVTLSVRSGRRRWTLKTGSVSSLRKHHSERLTLASALPAKLPAGLFTVWACADAAHRISESSEQDNCQRLGVFRIAATTHSTAEHAHADAALDYPHRPDRVHVRHASARHGLRGRLLGRRAALVRRHRKDPGDAVRVAARLRWRVERRHLHRRPGRRPRLPDNHVGGREDDCWDPNSDVPKVLAAIADVETHFNINRAGRPRRILLRRRPRVPHDLPQLPSVRRVTRREHLAVPRYRHERRAAAAAGRGNSGSSTSRTPGQRDHSRRPAGDRRDATRGISGDVAVDAGAPGRRSRRRRLPERTPTR